MFFSWSRFCHTDRLHGNDHKPRIFIRRSRQIQNKEVWFEYRIINFWLFSLARLGNIGPRSFLWGSRYAQSMLPWPRANNPPCDSQTRLVRSFSRSFAFIIMSWMTFKNVNIYTYIYIYIYISFFFWSLYSTVKKTKELNADTWVPINQRLLEPMSNGLSTRNMAGQPAPRPAPEVNYY